MTRARRALALLAWLVALAGVVVILQVSGRGSLRLPPLGDQAAWPRWLAETDSTVVAFAALRVLALGAAWYCLLVTLVGAGARLVRAATVVELADRVTLPPLRRLLSMTVSAGLATGLVGAGVATAAPPSTVPSAPTVTVTMHRLPPGAAGTAPAAPGTVPAPTTTAPTTTAPTTTATAPPTPTTTTTTTTTTVAGPRPARGADPSPVAPPATDARQWTVRPGDCFWSIAAHALAGAWGRTPTDAEIAPYWLRLVEANRAVLADGSNPDLIFPGQVFTLPPL